MKTAHPTNVSNLATILLWTTRHKFLLVSHPLHSTLAYCSPETMSKVAAPVHDFCRQLRDRLGSQTTAQAIFGISTLPYVLISPSAAPLVHSPYSNRADSLSKTWMMPAPRCSDMHACPSMHHSDLAVVTSYGHPRARETMSAIPSPLLSSKIQEKTSNHALLLLTTIQPPTLPRPMDLLKPWIAFSLCTLSIENIGSVRYAPIGKAGTQ